jgi:O-antigen ligase
VHKENKGDAILSFAAFFPTAVLMLQLLLIDSALVAHESFRNISIVLSAIPMALAMYYIINRSLLLFLVTYFLIFFLILLTLVIFPYNAQYLNSEAFYLLCINVPCFLCLASIRDIYILKRIMLYLSYAIFAIGIIYVYFLLLGRITFSTYSQSFSSYLLLPALVFVDQRNNIIYTFLFIITCILMLMLGSRGALVAAVIYTILISVIDGKNRRLIVLSIVIIIILSGSLLPLILKLSDKAGITSRSLNMLQQGNFTGSTGRLDIYYSTWNSILNTPFSGNGIYGDRVLLNGQYCHNIFLEMFHNFGLLFGAGLILLLSFIIIRVYHTSNNGNKKLLLLFFCYGFIPLLVSGSYLNNAEFGLFIGSLFLLSNNYFANYI